MISCFTKLNLDSICSLSSTFSIIVCEKKYSTRRSVYTNTHTHTAYSVCCVHLRCGMFPNRSLSLFFLVFLLPLFFLPLFFLSPPLFAVLYGYESSFILDLRLFLTIYLKNKHPKPINCCCTLRRNCRHPRYHLWLICILYCSDFRSKEDSVCVFYSLRSRACRAQRKPTQCYRHL